MVPRAMFDRWFGRAEPAPELSSALADLDRLGTDRPELAGPARGLAPLLVAAFDGLDPEPGPPTLPGPSPESRPIFQSHPPRLDRAILTRRLRRLVEALGAGNASAGPFAKAIRGKGFDLMAWVDSVLAGRPDDISRDAERLGVDPALAASTLRLTLLPSLARVSALLNGTRTAGVRDGGACPLCGCPPAFAESRGLSQQLYFRCGLCAAEWEGDHLSCPFCTESRPKHLQSLAIEGERDRCRLAACETCGAHWKVVSTLTALTPPAMIVADLATVHLDLLAADRRGESLDA